MANFKPASFIPKEPISSDDDTKKSGGPRRTSIIMLIASIITGFAVLFAAGVFGYKYYISSQLEAKKQQLQDVQSAFEPELIRDLISLDTRIKKAQTLLQDHTAVTPVFSLLEDETIQSVQINEIEMDIVASGMEVDARAIAQDYASVANQADALEENSIIQNPSVSAFAQGQESESQTGVSFEMQFTLPERIIQYNNTLQG